MPMMSVGAIDYGTDYPLYKAAISRRGAQPPLGCFETPPGICALARATGENKKCPYFLMHITTVSMGFPPNFKND
jgi:hypothetical protein